MQRVARCAWATNERLIAYHDAEWGVPVHDDRTLFEFLVLEGAQAGLSWDTILGKRAAYRSAFAGFDPAEVARFGPGEVEQLLRNPGLVRNRAKIEAAVHNARAFVEVQEEFGSFDAWIWQFTGYETIQNRWAEPGEVPAETAHSRAMSKALKARGFRFVGPIICYAFMQAVGMVNDHTTGCFRHAELS